VHDATFEDRIDSSLHMFACNNGVFLMDLPGAPFVPITPEHMIRRTTGWSYDPDEAEAMRLEVEHALAQLHPIAEERRLMLGFLSGVLDGSRYNEGLAICIDFRNDDPCYAGKSFEASLVKATFGEYCVNGSKLFKRPAGYLQFHKGVRVVVADNMVNDGLDQALLKDMTSPGSVARARKWSSDTEFSFPWCAGVMLFYDAHKEPHANDPLWDGALVVPFRSKFVPEARLAEFTEPHTFAMDVTIWAKIKPWRSAFLNILLDSFL
jgi:hypothetical protein